MGPKCIFGVESEEESSQKDTLGWRQGKRINIRWEIGSIAGEIAKAFPLQVNRLIESLNSLTNCQMRLFLTLYLLSRGGKYGVLARGRVIRSLAKVDRGHYWRYLRELSRLGFVGSCSDRRTVVVSYEDGTEDSVFGRILWIGGRGAIDSHEEEKEEGLCKNRGQVDSKAEEIPGHIKTVLVYP